jgi:hypothetical protein
MSVRVLVRRAALLACLVVATSVPALASPAAASTVDGLFDHPGAKQGAYLSMDAHNGTDELSAYRRFETRWGRRAEMVRVFTSWNQPALFTPAQKTMAAEGRTLVLSWNSWDRGTGIRWSEVASGAHDAMIDARAQEVKDFGHPLLFTFQHEPENWTDTLTKQRAGTSADFCRAYRRVVERFRAAQVTNASYGEIMMAWTALRGKAEYYYCGDDVVDWLAADGYNWYGCSTPSGPWRMPQTVFDPWYTWASGHDKPLIIAEWGTGEDIEVPARKGEWIDALNTMLRNRPAIKGAIIFNSGRNKSCPRYSDTSPSSQAAFVAMGADPYFAPTDLAPLVAPDAPNGVTLTQVTHDTATVTWAPPAHDGGAELTGYTVSWEADAAAGAPPAISSEPADVRSRTLSGLVDGATYTVTVKASNVAGEGAASTATLTVGPLRTRGAPTSVTAMRGAAQATLSWVAPESGDASPIVGYRVRRYAGTEQTASGEVLVASTDTTYTMTGLTNGSTYTFDVAALNEFGAGPASEPSNAVVPATTPSAPKIGVATSGIAGGAITATATWSPPASTGGSEITAYEVRALRMSDTGTVLGRTTVRQPGTARSVEMTLPRVASYRFVVLALNDVGMGARSLRSNLVAGQ